VSAFGLPSLVHAQEGGESTETGSTTTAQNEAGDGTEESATDSGDESTSDSSDADSQAAAQSGDSEASETAGASDDASKTKSSAQEGDSDDAKAGASQKGDASDEAKKGDQKEGKKMGPGGREMRTDYPGTEASKQESMETDRIEGLQFDEGQNPSKAYDMEIKELETKIDDLKDKVFQSKSRIVLLKETVLGGNLSGSRATIIHDNRLGSQFTLERALYSLDGSRVFNKVGKDALAGKNELTVYDGSITTGNHNVSIVLEYKGSGYGIFNYMDGYEVRITSSCQFQAQAGKATTLRVKAVKKGGAFTRVENQPGIQCRITETELSKNKMESLQAEGSSSGESSSEAASGAGAK
jgi:hypothetical protein